MKEILVGDMSFELPGAGVPEDMLCRYGESRMVCRGPRRRLDAPYVAFLGGSETFGRFVDRPFVARIEQETGIICVNLGSANSGLDAYVQDADILKIAGDAQLAVIQVMGAPNLSNRYYRVHPRRNDRFLAPSPLLKTLFQEVDFTEFHFNKHLLGNLHRVSTARFRVVQQELRELWLARMGLLLEALPHKPVLLWLRYAAEPGEVLGPKPLLVDRQMLEQLYPAIAEIIEIQVERTAESDELGRMRFGPMQAPAASYMIGPSTHHAIADRVSAVLRDRLRKRPAV